MPAIVSIVRLSVTQEKTLRLEVPRIFRDCRDFWVVNIKSTRRNVVEVRAFAADRTIVHRFHQTGLNPAREILRTLKDIAAA